MLTAAVEDAPRFADLRIGEWRAREESNELSRGSERVRIEPKTMEVLLFLAARVGSVVTREELLAHAWPGVIVGDEALTQVINKLRKALGDDSHHPRYIETLSKRGYRLVANVAPSAIPSARRHHKLAVLAGIAAGIALVIFAWTRLGPAPELPRASPQPVVAILPLVNAGGNATRDYFIDGITEDLINALGRFSAVRVISPASVQRFKGQPIDLPQLRRELGVRYVLTGSVRESGDNLRVSVELSDASNGAVRWSERYDGAGGDVFKIQDEVVRHIVASLDVKVAGLELERASSKAPQNLEAYDLVLRARALAATSDRVANRQARELLARAVKLAPGYAEAWVVSSNAEMLRSLFGWTEAPNESLRMAEEHARRALAIDEPGAHSRAYGLLGVIYSSQGRFDDALEQVDRAIALNASDSFAHDMRGATLLWLGRFDDAVVSLDTAARYNPAVRSAASGFNRALAQFMLGNSRKAIATADETLAVHPQAPFLHAIRAAALARAGRMEEARKAADTARRLDPFFQPEQFGTRFVNRDHYATLQAGLRLCGL